MTAPARSEGTGGGGLMRRVRGRLVAALAAVRIAASARPLLDPPGEAPHGRLAKLAIRRFARSGLRLPSEASPAGPGAPDGAADPETAVGRSRLLILALVGIPVLINAVMLLSELTSGAPNLNDDAFHYLLVQRAGDAVASGRNPLDFWMPQLELGFPQFLYYQNLPHLAVVGLNSILLGTVDQFTTFNLVRYLLLVGFPLTVYWSMRRMGFSMVAAAVGAAASSLLSANSRYGFEYDSYIWRGFGLYTQLWAMHLSFISLACVWRVLQRGTGYLLAILALTALCLSHLIYAYMMVITLGLILLVFVRRGTIRATLTRLLILGGVVTAATAWMWLPFLTSYQYLGASPYLQREKYDSFGAPAILGWLLSGDLLDHGRLPVLTVLLGLGILAAIVRRSRIGIAALAGFFLWLVLYFGRPTLGPIADLFPLHDGLLFHRFVGDMDLFAIILMGVGGAWLWRTVARLRIPRLRPDLRAAVAFAVVLLVLVPAVTERIGFYAQNTIWMGETADAFHSDADLQAILSTLAAQPPGGRTYAGLRTNWGAQMTVGQTKVTDALTFDAIPAVSPPYQSLSLNADMIWSFRDDDPGQFDLMDVRYVIAPAGLAVPSFYTPMQKTTKYALYRVQTSGAAEYVAITARRQAPTQRALFDANLAWFKGPDPDARRFIRWDYETPAGPPTTSAGCPGGGKTDFEYDASDAVHVVVECPASATLAIKVTYHPNWHVSVDGQPVETFMVSPSFVGINLPAGKHTVDATYEATPTKTPLFLLGLGVLGLAVVLRRRFDWLPQRFGTSSWPSPPPADRRGPMSRFQRPRDRMRAAARRILHQRLGPARRKIGGSMARATAVAPDFQTKEGAIALGTRRAALLSRGRPRLALQGLAIVVGLVLLVLSQQIFDLGRSYVQGDYYQFWAVGRLAPTGVTDIYSDEARHQLGSVINAEATTGTSSRAVDAAARWKVLETYGTPFFYALFGTLSTGDYDLDSAVWQLVGIGCLLAGILAMGRVFGYPIYVSLIAAAVVIGTSQALFSDVRTGNVSELQVGLMALFIVMRARWRTARGTLAAGVLLGLSVAFKPNIALVPVLLIVLWLIDRRFSTLVRQVGGMALGGVIALVIGTLAWGSIQPWFDWIGSVGALGGQAAYTIADGNYALSRLLLENAGVNTPTVLLLVLIVASIGAMGLGAYRQRGPTLGRRPVVAVGRLGDPDDDNFERECLVVGVAVAIVLLASPLSWLFYYLLLIPIQLFLLRWRPGVAPVGQAIRVALIALTLVLCALHPIGAPGLNPFDPAWFAVEMILATAIVFALAIIELAGWGLPAAPRLSVEYAPKG